MQICDITYQTDQTYLTDQTSERELDPDVRTGTGEISAFSPRRFHPVSSARDSRDIVAPHGPAIVIAASGISTLCSRAMACARASIDRASLRM